MDVLTPLAKRLPGLRAEFALEPRRGTGPWVLHNGRKASRCGLSAPELKTMALRRLGVGNSACTLCEWSELDLDAPVWQTRGIRFDRGSGVLNVLERADSWLKEPGRSADQACTLLQDVRSLTRIHVRSSSRELDELLASVEARVVEVSDALIRQDLVTALGSVLEDTRSAPRKLERLALSSVQDAWNEALADTLHAVKLVPHRDYGVLLDLVLPHKGLGPHLHLVERPLLTLLWWVELSTGKATVAEQVDVTGVLPEHLEALGVLYEPRTSMGRVTKALEVACAL